MNNQNDNSSNEDSSNAQSTSSSSPTLADNQGEEIPNVNIQGPENIILTEGYIPPKNSTKKKSSN